MDRQLPTLPFAGATPITKHCSYLGAVDAEARAGAQAKALLAAYRERGPLTDHEAGQVLRVPVTTICARRRDLRRLGLIAPCGWRKGPYGIKNTTHGVLRDEEL